MDSSIFNDQYHQLSEEFVTQHTSAPESISEPFSLPTLYTYTISTKKYKRYQVGFNGTHLVSEYGQVDGKLRVNHREIVPKVNRTLYEQAYLETRSLWSKKIKQRYMTSMSDGEAVMRRQVMLANKFDISRVKFPIWLQIKYDGIRFTAGLVDDRVELRSRAGNEFHHLEHLREALRPILEDLTERFPDDTILIDGELILPEATFQETCSVIKSLTQAHPRNNEIEAMVFDVMINEPYEERWGILSEYIEKGSLNLVDSVIVDDHEGIQWFFNDVTSKGHEGVMVRDPSSLYVNGRTNNIMKMKVLETDEGEIIDVIDGTGSHTGLAIFVLKDSLGIVTHVVPASDQEQRREWFNSKEDLIGRRYQFMFNERMKGTNAPRNPIGSRFV